MIIPIGVENAQVDRVPWVSIVIALVNIAVFAGTCGIYIPDEALLLPRQQAVLTYAADHPYLRLTEDCEMFANDEEGVLEAPREVSAPTSPKVLREEQARLDKLCATLVSTFTKPEFARFGMTPARGILRIGLLTHIFLHADIFHLLGNLLFFYIVALLLEDIWGRGIFLVFYIVGGMLAGVAQALLDTSSPIPVIGASGAVAACMGAFTFRFATRRIKMAYWFFIFFRGTFFIPAWLWGGFWFASEVWNWRTDPTGGGVAVMAHIGGFVVGFLTALVVKFTGFETQVLAPRLTGLPPPTALDPDMVAGNKAYDAGKWLQARMAYRRVLDRQPENLDAWWALAHVAVQLSEMPALHKALDRILSINPDAAPDVIETFGAMLSPPLLQPRAAQVMAGYLEGTQPAQALPYLDVAGQAEGRVGAEALLRGVDLCQRLSLPSEEMLKRARLVVQKPGVPPELFGRARALLPAAAVAPVAAAPVVAPTPPPVSVPSTRPVYHCKFTGRAGQGWMVLSSDGRATQVQPAMVKAVGAAVVMVPTPAGAPRAVLVTDVVLHGVMGVHTILRFTSDGMGLETVYPGQPMPQAHQALLRELAAPPVHAWPSLEALSTGGYPQVPSPEAFEAGFDGSLPA